MSYTDNQNKNMFMRKLLRRGYIRHGLTTLLAPRERFHELECEVKKYGFKILIKP